MTWYSTARGNYRVAHRDEDTGTVLLDFGKYDGRALDAVPDLRHGADVIAWADRAPAGDVAEVATRCRIIADTLTAVLDDRAGSTLAQLLEEVG